MKCFYNKISPELKLWNFESGTATAVHVFYYSYPELKLWAIKRNTATAV
jgi:hypothetical protein